MPGPGGDEAEANRGPARRATVVNMLEEQQGVARFKGGKVALDLRPFEIRTLRFSREPGA